MCQIEVFGDENLSAPLYRVSRNWWYHQLWDILYIRQHQYISMYIPLAPTCILKRAISHELRSWMPLPLWITLASVRWTHGIECRVRFKTKTMPAPNSREMPLYRRVTSAILPQSTRSRIFFLSRAESFEYSNENNTSLRNNRAALTIRDAICFPHYLVDNSIFRFLIDRSYADCWVTSLQFKLINFTLNFSETILTLELSRWSKRLIYNF